MLPEPDEQPAVVVLEHRGRLKVGIAPLVAKAGPGLSRRESTQVAIAAALQGEPMPHRSDLPIDLIVDFPIGQLAVLCCEHFEARNHVARADMVETLLKESGFRRLREDDRSPPVAIVSDHAELLYRRIDFPMWSRWR